MLIWFIRLFFLISLTIIGSELGQSFQKPELGMILGGVLAILVIILEIFTRKISLRGLSSAVFGLLLGIIMAKILIQPVKFLPLSESMISGLEIIFIFVFSYLGVVLALRGKDEFNIIIPYVKFKRIDLKEENYILDTSSIIDGRILDVIKTGFLEGRFIIPRFILAELQKISDSQDPLKRQRGRRGLEILNSIKREPKIDLKIHAQDFEEIKDVDAKIVRLAQMLDAKVITTDYNLNRICELEGIKVLNINELANALKPIFLPGERLNIKLIKEGKEYNQAVGYLDDGTMVVVENAKSLIGKEVEVIVSSILQTPAGRIIFCKLPHEFR